MSLYYTKIQFFSSSKVKMDRLGCLIDTAYLIFTICFPNFFCFCFNSNASDDG